MTFLEMDTKPESFLDTILNSEVRIQVKCALKWFEEFSKSEYEGRTTDDIIAELRELENKPKFKGYLYSLMQKFANYLVGKNLKPVTVRKYFMHFRNYLKHSGFEISNDDVKENVKMPRIVESEHYPLSLKELQSIMGVIPAKHKALFFTLASSGIRIKEAVQLRKRDFDTNLERIKITIPAKYAKSAKSRITFVTDETKEWLLPKLRRLKPDDLVFSINEDPHKARQNEEERFERIRLNAGFCNCVIDRRNHKWTKDDSNCKWKYDTGHHKITIHSFRSWFITKTNRIDFGFGHALAGHGLYMSRYDRMTDEEKIEMYIKCEPTLQIVNGGLAYNDEIRDKEIQELKESITELKKERMVETETMGFVNKILAHVANSGKMPTDEKRLEWTDQSLKRIGMTEKDLKKFVSNHLKGR